MVEYSSNLRLYEKLYKDIGEDIISYLNDKDVSEVIVNPDGKLWIDSASQGMKCVSLLSEDQILSIILNVAGIKRKIINEKKPRLETSLPFFKTLQGERFTAQLPPVVEKPCFLIRRKMQLIPLENYIQSGRLTLTQSNLLKELINQRKNIVVSGGPKSGKSVFTNALIAEMVKQDSSQRIIILEDTSELWCDAPNQWSKLTNDEGVDMQVLLKEAMRESPHRILIGEVRGKEAYEMLKAWNTGCPGGISTIHANSANATLQRIQDLCLEANLSEPPISLICEAVQIIVHLNNRDNQKGFIEEILSLEGYKEGKYVFKKQG